jgi:serine/threonine protein kinase
MQLWMRLPAHPNIVPFDRVVVDEIHGRVIGFTSKYIPGGTLDKATTRVFKIAWLHQLLDVVDFLKCECGIAHQDIAPRNLLVDEATDSLMLFDFNFASRIDKSVREFREGYREDRNDVKGVIFTVYEIITGDNTLRSVPHEQQRIASTGGAWKQGSGVKLDRHIEDYRVVLFDWVERRQTGVESAQKPSYSLKWPPWPEPPSKTIRDVDLQGNSFSYSADQIQEKRSVLLEKGERVLSWERPPQDSLKTGARLLSTGQYIRDK